LLIEDIVEFATVGKTKDGKIYHHLWGADEITTLLKEHGLAKEEDAEAG
jgi:20S proteasome subunit alpha 3